MLAYFDWLILLNHGMVPGSYACGMVHTVTRCKEVSVSMHNNSPGRPKTGVKVVFPNCSATFFRENKRTHLRNNFALKKGEC